MTAKQAPALRMLIFALVICALLPSQSFAEKRNDSRVSSWKLKAQKAAEAGHYDQADTFYVQGIEEAKRNADYANLLNLISALVRERCANKRAATVNDYVQTAIQTVKKIKGSRNYDPEMSVWMDDLADVLYTHGDNEQDMAMREYCAKNYVIIECLVHDRIDNQIGSRALLTITSLQEEKKYRDAIELLEALISYLKRTAPHDIEKISSFYYSLGIACLGANEPDKADTAFQTCLNLDKQMVSKHPMHDAHVIFIERYSAMAKEEQGKLIEAEALGHVCVNNHAKYIAPTHVFTAGDYLVLARILKKLGKNSEAAHYYTLGLGSFDSLAKATKSRDYDAGRALACEGLAEMDLKTGNTMQAHELRGKITLLSRVHSNWPAKLTDDDAFFFGLWNHLPMSVDPIKL